MPTYALLGYPLSHSFSKRYFTEKFERLELGTTHQYLNFELDDINQIRKKLEEYGDIVGFNVTIPYKQAIIPFLSAIDPVAERIGAVNTVRVRSGHLEGFNTDYSGFRDDLLATIQAYNWQYALDRQSALILGTGGGSLAVAEALRELGTAFTFVSRQPQDGQLSYTQLTPEVMAAHRLIVNTTPLGMHPRIDMAPAIPYHLLTPDHFCYDLVYNPAETTFMRRASTGGIPSVYGTSLRVAGVANGLGMLHRQAEAAWRIWNE